MLELKKVFKKFESKSIIRNLDLFIDRGEKITIIGPSGSGKSTILKLILGLILPDSGQILVEGNDITAMKTTELNKVRSDIGLLFQSGALFDSLTVEENVSFPLIEQEEEISPFEIRKRVKRAFDMVEMTGFGDKYPAELSGGQRKRVGLARAIIRNPKMILYDEPTTGLDPILSTNIENLINKLSKELDITTITVTHQLSTIFRASDKIYYLHKGSLLEPETPKNIKNSPQEILRAFIQGRVDEK